MDKEKKVVYVRHAAEVVECFGHPFGEHSPILRPDPTVSRRDFWAFPAPAGVNKGLTTDA